MRDIFGGLRKRELLEDDSASQYGGEDDFNQYKRGNGELNPYQNEQDINQQSQFQQQLLAQPQTQSLQQPTKFQAPQDNFIAQNSTNVVNQQQNKIHPSLLTINDIDPSNPYANVNYDYDNKLTQANEYGTINDPYKWSDSQKYNIDTLLYNKQFGLENQKHPLNDSAQSAQFGGMDRAGIGSYAGKNQYVPTFQAWKKGIDPSKLYEEAGLASPKGSYSGINGSWVDDNLGLDTVEKRNQRIEVLKKAGLTDSEAWGEANRGFHQRSEPEEEQVYQPQQFQQQQYQPQLQDFQRSAQYQNYLNPFLFQNQNTFSQPQRTPSSYLNSYANQHRQSGFTNGLLGQSSDSNQGLLANNMPQQLYGLLKQYL